MFYAAWIDDGVDDERKKPKFFYFYIFGRAQLTTDVGDRDDLLSHTPIRLIFALFKEGAESGLTAFRHTIGLPKGEWSCNEPA